MERQEIYLDALNRSNTNRELRQEVIRLRSEGVEKDVIIAELEELRKLVPDDEAKEDLILEVLDFLVGFCSPHMFIE